MVINDEDDENEGREEEEQVEDEQTGKEDDDDDESGCVVSVKLVISALTPSLISFGCWSFFCASSLVEERRGVSARDFLRGTEESEDDDEDEDDAMIKRYCLLHAVKTSFIPIDLALTPSLSVQD